MVVMNKFIEKNRTSRQQKNNLLKKHNDQPIVWIYQKRPTSLQNK